MENFNLLTALLTAKFGRTDGNKIIGKHGDLTKTPLDWRTNEPKVGHTSAQVLVVNQRDNYLEWKKVYVNRKGYYYKRDGNRYFKTD